MKQLLAILIIGIIVGSCSRPHVKQLTIDPAFQPYFNSFQQASVQENAALDTDDLIIAFGELGAANPDGSGTAGQCIYQPGATPIIVINNNPAGAFIWSKATEATREILLYHEMGHCLLLRVHTSAMWVPTYTGGAYYDIPISIMYPYILDDYTYLLFKQHYMDEMFHPGMFL